MTENASVEDDGGRRFPTWISLALAVLLLYLIVSWLQVAGRHADKATQMKLEGVWLVVRPVWLYPVGLLTVLFLLVVFVAYPVAARLTSRASWRALVIVQANSALRQLERLCARGGPDCQQEDSAYAATRTHLEEARQAATPPPRSKRWRRDLLLDAWTGASIEAAFRNLHAAEVAMVPLLSKSELKARTPRCSVA